MRIIKRSISGLAWALLAAVFSGSLPALASPTVSIQPSSSMVAPGQTFSLDIFIADVPDLFAFQFDLSFDPTILAATRIQEGSFLSSGHSTFFVPGSIDKTLGTITFTAGTLVGPTSGISGMGTLARVQFVAFAPAPSTVRLSNVLLLDSGLSLVPTSVADGTVDVSVELSCSQQIVNEKVAFVVKETSYNPAPTGNGPAGTFTVGADLRNRGSELISEPLEAVVITLTNGSRILSATEGMGGSQPRQAIAVGGALDPGETVRVTFRIGLAVRKPFTFFVDVEGCTRQTLIFPSPGEGSLLGPGGILDTLYGLENLARIDDDLDQWWINRGGAATARAKFATFPQTLGFVDVSEEFHPVFTESGDGFGVSASGTLPDADVLSTFRWGLQAGGDQFGSRPRNNTDGADHMVTWLITGGPNAGNLVIAWEDVSGLGDKDYQDLVVEISHATPTARVNTLAP